MTFRPSRFATRLVATFACLLCTAAVAGDGDALIARLRQAFQAGIPLPRAETLLREHGANFSRRSATECEAMASKTAMAAQLKPRGGPCVFGKIPVAKSWTGLRTDVILQLTFSPDGKLADGNFEEISSF